MIHTSSHPLGNNSKFREIAFTPKASDLPQRDIAQIIKQDKALPKKQRHTAKRIYERIKEMRYESKYTQVKQAVREIRRLRQEVSMPLSHHPGEAQIDFGYAPAKVGGV